MVSGEWRGTDSWIYLMPILGALAACYVYEKISQASYTIFDEKDLKEIKKDSSKTKSDSQLSKRE